MYFRILSLLFFLTSLAFSYERVLKLAPLPMSDAVKTTKIFLPFVNYIEKKIPVKIEFVHLSNYEDIIEGLEKDEIDLAYLGPLPYAVLKKTSKNFFPIIGFLEKDGSRGYHCVLAASDLDSIPYNNLKNKKIALTQPLSTCGYFMASKLLKSLNSTDINDMKFRYLKKHTKVAEAILQGEFLLGGMKDSVAQEFQNLGLRTLKTSEMLPSFILVANGNTISKKYISKLQYTLLETPKKEYSKWGHKISYGMFEVNSEDFLHIEEALDNMTIPEKGNF